MSKLLQKPRSVWRIAVRPLVVGTIMCLVAAAMSGSVHWLASNIALDLSKAQTIRNTANLTLENRQSEKARLAENLQMFDKLKLAHFVQMPDRLALLEALQVAANDLQKSTLVWELGAQETLKSLNDDQTGEAVAQLMRVPMKLSASATHEQEWMSLLARLQSSGAGLFTTDSCTYRKKSHTLNGILFPAVDIQCELSWFYVVAVGVATKSP